jgi:hypothetical protein
VTFTEESHTMTSTALDGLDRTAPTPAVVLSYGLGVDSTAILLRWLHEPETRPAAIRTDLSRLVVVTAMTGDEWADTGRDVTDHVLPLMREHGVRFVQAARSQRHTTTAGEGVVVLDDSTRPEVLHLEGAYKLSDEMREAGTVPQSSGARLCSVHSKGDVLDPVISAITRGQSYLHVIGFESEERGRAYGTATKAGDVAYNTDTRTGSYPLIEWDWNRATCVDYIASKTQGTAWQKSACTFCPFAFQNRDGLSRVLPRFAADPQRGVDALVMEHLALALNPRQGLVGGRALVDELRRTRQHGHVVEAMREQLDELEHVVYRVRRVYAARKDDPQRASTNAARSIHHAFTGSRAAADAVLEALAAEGGLSYRRTFAGHLVAEVIVRSSATAPGPEEFLVVAPAGAVEKDGNGFEKRWAEGLAWLAAQEVDDEQLALV